MENPVLTDDNHFNALVYGEAPARTLAALRASGELAVWLPELDALYGVPQPAKYHPEICSGRHIELVLEMAEQLGASPRTRFAALIHDLGKALTPKDKLPQHISHEVNGLVPVSEVCERFAVAADWKALAMAVCEFHLIAHRALEMRPSTFLRFVKSAGLEQDSTFAHDFVTACEADKRGREGLQDADYPQGRLIEQVVDKLSGLPDLSTGEDMNRLVQDRHRVRLSVVWQVKQSADSEVAKGGSRGDSI